MKLFHGSNLRIKHPDTCHSRKNLDFGQGFYLTSFSKQAEKWALRKVSFDGGSPIVTVFNFSDDLSSFKTLKFPENDACWVEFGCEARRGNVSSSYDLIIGGVADDKVYEAVNMYFKGYWDMQTTLAALSYYERNGQYCFASQSAIDELLSFDNSYEVQQ